MVLWKFILDCKYVSWLVGWMDVVYGCVVDEYFDGDFEFLDNNFEDIDIYEVGGIFCM